MSASPASLQRQLGTAGELHGVVRTMKAMAATHLNRYLAALAAVDEFHTTVQLGLALCLRAVGDGAQAPVPVQALAIVFGSDQGMVGGFNERVARHAAATLAPTAIIWAVGARADAALRAAGRSPATCHALPAAPDAIGLLVSQLLSDLDTLQATGGAARVDIVYQAPTAQGVAAVASLPLLPLDLAWQQQAACHPWPGHALPQIAGVPSATLAALLGEHLFVLLYRACAASQASELGCRLAEMTRAEQNIGTLRETLARRYHLLRQDRVDAELFDLVAGFEALARR